MPLTFPASPTVGQTSTQNGREYIWTGYAWELAPSPAAVTSVNGATGAVTVQKTITSGTAAPAGGSDGDIYLRYT